MSTEITTREQKLLQGLLTFFAKDVNIKILLDIVIFKNTNVSLRVFDWFVTNYAKKFNVSYQIKRPNNTCEVFYVYRSYLAQLKGSKKKEFDPFCRGSTIKLEYIQPSDHSKIIFETALCQLKFFKWAIENLVIEYVEANLSAIQEDMKNCVIKHQHQRPESLTCCSENENKTSTKRKSELSQSMIQQFYLSKQKTVVAFPINSHVKE